MGFIILVLDIVHYNYNVSLLLNPIKIIEQVTLLSYEKTDFFH